MYNMPMAELDKSFATGEEEGSRDRSVNPAENYTRNKLDVHREGRREETYSAFTIIYRIGMDDAVQKGSLEKRGVI